MACTFIQITDHHLREAEGSLTAGYSTTYALRTVMQHMAAVIDRADFLISTGDLVETPTDAAYQHVCQVFQARPSADQALGHQLVAVGHRRDVPMYFLPGNHDDRDRFFHWMLPHTAPQPFLNFAFERDGVQFIMLDWGPASKGYGHPELFQFLRQALVRGLPAVLFMHYHIVPSYIPWVDALIAENVHELWPIVRDKPILGIFCGHAHCTYEAVVKGIPIFGLRSTAPQFVPQARPLLCLQPPHYRLVHIQDALLTTRIFEVPL
jgi:3',5'-cyclic AMP phosphodiesterase CpdA